MLNNFRRKICSSNLPKFTTVFAGYHGRRPPPIPVKTNRTFIDSDRVEQEKIPSFIRDRLAPAANNAPFTEVHGESFFNSVLRAMDRSHKRDGPPKRLSLNLESVSLENIMRVMKDKKRDLELFDQRYIPERQEQLGYEIAAAHFIVYRGGGVKFYGNNQWIKCDKKEDKNYDMKLPKRFIPDLYLEAIDLSGMNIRYEGLMNLDKLVRLKWLSCKNCVNIDDWCLDRITCQFRHSLEYLDISDCPKITYRGLSALYKIKNLQVLVANNISSSHEFQLSCLMLEDIFPNLQIKGVKFIELDENKNDVNKTDEKVIKKDDNTVLDHSFNN